MSWVRQAVRCMEASDSTVFGLFGIGVNQADHLGVRVVLDPRFLLLLQAMPDVREALLDVLRATCDLAKPPDDRERTDVTITWEGDEE